MSILPRFPKPGQREGLITLTTKQRAEKRKALYLKQCGICACGCGKRMSEEYGRMDSCTLEHITPQPAGHAKNDRDDNLEATRWDHNISKGSRRIKRTKP